MRVLKKSLTPCPGFAMRRTYRKFELALSTVIVLLLIGSPLHAQTAAAKARATTDNIRADSVKKANAKKAATTAATPATATTAAATTVTATTAAPGTKAAAASKPATTSTAALVTEERQHVDQPDFRHRVFVHQPFDGRARRQRCRNVLAYGRRQGII